MNFRCWQCSRQDEIPWLIFTFTLIFQGNLKIKSKQEKGGKRLHQRGILMKVNGSNRRSHESLDKITNREVFGDEKDCSIKILHSGEGNVSKLESCTTFKIRQRVMMLSRWWMKESIKQKQRNNSMSLACISAIIRLSLFEREREGRNITRKREGGFLSSIASLVSVFLLVLEKMLHKLLPDSLFPCFSHPFSHLLFSLSKEMILLFLFQT